MKTCALFLILLSIIPFSLSTSRGLHDSPAQPVFTINGRELRPGRPYFLVHTSPSSPFGAGLDLTSNANNSICPFNIAQASTVLGYPFNFDAFRSPGASVIREDTPLYVVIPEPPENSCPEQTLWTVAHSAGDNIVVAGEPQVFVADTAWYFKIQSVATDLPHGYKISYCEECLNCIPTVVTTCHDVGIREIGGERLLVLDDENPLIHQFVDIFPWNSII